MPYFIDLAPERAALFERASGHKFLDLCGKLLDEGLNVYVIYRRAPPRFELLLFGLAADALIEEHELPIDLLRLDEGTRLGLLDVWVDTTLARSRLQAACTALKLKEFEARPPKFAKPAARPRPKRSQG
jgi:hypothetical protein